MNQAMSSIRHTLDRIGSGFNQRVRMGKRLAIGFGSASLAFALTAGTVAATATQYQFEMVPSGGAAQCLPNARANVQITQLGPVEVMRINATGLPPNIGLSTFITQVPNPPFGVSWYQGELDTDRHGHGSQRYIGRFNIETFALALDKAPAPVINAEGPLPDASENVPFNPVRTLHVGMWFGDPADAKAAGCGDLVTPFDGDREAGIQVLSTRNFPDLEGPLRNVVPAD